jgi:hypothetical protein
MLRWGIAVLVVAVSAGGLSGPAAAELGSFAADLVYTPVPLCRIIDTRLAGGPISPGEPRNFVVAGTLGFEAQGGRAGGCGIPDAAAAAMLNFNAVNASGAGNLRASPFGQPMPQGSIITYAGVLDLENGVVVPLCDPTTAPTGCSFDVSVQADESATDLVVDVMGFFRSTAPRGDAGRGNTFLGVNAGNFTMSGTSNTATGANALLGNTSGSINTATGFEALLSNTTGSANTATGFSALRQNLSGESNTATGFSALRRNTMGNFNTATGNAALLANTGGSGNTAMGAFALSNSTTASGNTAIGLSALQSATGANNTAVGSNAGFNIRNPTTTGGDNVFIGANAGSNQTSGSSNTAVGAGALSGNTTGENNLAIGQNAGTQIRTGSNNIYIGNEGFVQDEGVIRIGREGAVNRTLIFGIRDKVPSTQDGITVLVGSRGQLGTTNSSRRVKEDIRDMGAASRGLLRLRPVVFRYRQPAEDGAKRLQYGLIAEEVAEVLPELVAYGSDGQPQTVLYHVLPALLVNELQRQEAELAALRQELAAQAAALAALQSRLAGRPSDDR